MKLKITNTPPPQNIIFDALEPLSVFRFFGRPFKACLRLRSNARNYVDLTSGDIYNGNAQDLVVPLEAELIYKEI